MKYLVETAIRRSSATLAALLGCYVATAQNLVPNPSFEHTAVCKAPSPSSRLSSDFCWWESNCSSADLYSSCNKTAPDNSHGYELPKHGRNYLGLAIGYREINTPLYTERIQAKLLLPLEEGHRYVLTFNISMAESSLMSSASIQLGFSRRKLQDQLMFSRLWVRKVLGVLPGQVADTSGWQRVSCVYTAKGNERYINLGNFRTRLSKRLNPAPGFENSRNGCAYYLFDDISVIEIPDNYAVSAGNDSLLKRFPVVGDTLAPGCAFEKDAVAIGEAMRPGLDRLADYLRTDPFVTGVIAFDPASGFAGSRLEKTFAKREIALELYFESKGISSNRIHYAWTPGETRFTVAEIIYP